MSIYQFLFVIMLIPLSSFAETTSSDTSDESAIEAAELNAVRPIEGQRNYFGFGLQGVSSELAPGFGYNFYFAHRLADQLTLGAAVSGFGGGKDSAGSGDLIAGQFYKDHAEYISTTAEMNATYFFRDSGYKRFGFLMRVGTGIEWGRINGYFKRFDKDPGFFSSGERLQESGPTQQLTFARGFLRLEPAYQFLWAPLHGTHIGGHTLELATSFMVSDSLPTMLYTRTDGVVTEVKAPRWISAFKVSYIMVF